MSRRTRGSIADEGIFFLEMVGTAGMAVVPIVCRFDP
jgi:hypothetical protein